MNYIRNAEAVRKYLTVTSTHALVTAQDCEIHMPIRFPDRELGSVGTLNTCYGFFPLIMSDGNYMVFNFNAICELNPYKFTETTIEEEEYIVLHFKKGDVVIKSLDVVRSDTLIENAMDEFIFKGKLPWYADYDKDVCKLFSTASSHADNRIAFSNQLFELLGSSVCRLKSDVTKYIRDNDKKGGVPFQSVGINNIYYSVQSPINKITGSYMREGVISSLNIRSKKIGKIEKILRS